MYGVDSGGEACAARQCTHVGQREASGSLLRVQPAQTWALRATCAVHASTSPPTHAKATPQLGTDPGTCISMVDSLAGENRNILFAPRGPGAAVPRPHTPRGANETNPAHPFVGRGNVHSKEKLHRFERRSASPRGQARGREGVRVACCRTAPRAGVRRGACG